MHGGGGSDILKDTEHASLGTLAEASAVCWMPNARMHLLNKARSRLEVWAQKFPLSSPCECFEYFMCRREAHAVGVMHASGVLHANA